MGLDRTRGEITSLRRDGGGGDVFASVQKGDRACNIDRPTVISRYHVEGTAFCPGEKETWTWANSVERRRAAATAALFGSFDQAAEGWQIERAARVPASVDRELQRRQRVPFLLALAQRRLRQGSRADAIIEHDLVHDHQLQPGLADSEHQIDVLPIAKALVEEADDIEDLPAEQAGTKIDVSYDFAWLASGRQGAGLEFAEALDQPRDDVRPVGSGEPVHLTRNLVARPDIVAVQKGDEGAAGSLEADVARSTRAQPIAGQDPQTGVLPGHVPQPCHSVVGRAIVDDEDLVDGPSLRHDRGHGLADKVFDVVCRNDDADAVHRRSRRTVSRSC